MFNYCYEGAYDEEELRKNPCIYKSRTILNPTNIQESKSISPKFTEKLAKINGKYSLGNNMAGIVGNAHLYTPSAETLDGRDRICYIQERENILYIKEHCSNSGAKYSSLYRLLIDKLDNNGFAMTTKGEYRITDITIDKFVNIVNRLIEEHESNIHMLYPGEIEPMTILNMKRYYYQAYWKEKEERIKHNNHIDFSEIQIISFAHNIMKTNDIEQLKIYKDKINKILALLDAKIHTVKILEDI